MAEFTNIKINDVQYDVKDASAARASDLAAKQDVINDLSTIRSGAAAGATALQSYTETDPTVPAWAKSATKPSYTASEISGLSAVATSGNYNDLSNKPTIPAAVTVDSTITQNGTNPVQGGAIYSALEGKADKPIVVEIVDWGTFHEKSSGYKYTGVELSFSYQEIMSAWNSGRQIYISDGENLYSLVGDPSEGYVNFSSFGWEGNTTQTVISVGSDDSVSITHHYDVVETTRTINGKALSSDITLSASDVGALPNNTHIPADQVQSNWNETNTSSKAYIQNKPTFKTINGESIVGTGDIEAGKVKSVSVNNGTPSQPDAQGNVNLTVATGGDNDLVDLSDGTENDGAVVFTKRNGDTITLNLNHVHPQYLKYELLADESAYNALTTKDSSTLYLIPES